MDLNINSNLVIPSIELKWKFSKSRGPGGQNVNKVESKVELIFDIVNSPTLSPQIKKILIDRLHTQLTQGSIRIIAMEERSQYLNRKLAAKRLIEVIQKNLKPLKIRKSTQPTIGSRNRRLKIKKNKSNLKKKRQHRFSIDEE